MPAALPGLLPPGAEEVTQKILCCIMIRIPMDLWAFWMLMCCLSKPPLVPVCLPRSFPFDGSIIEFEKLLPALLAADTTFSAFSQIGCPPAAFGRPGSTQPECDPHG